MDFKCNTTRVRLVRWISGIVSSSIDVSKTSLKKRQNTTIKNQKEETTVFLASGQLRECAVSTSCNPIIVYSVPIPTLKLTLRQLGAKDWS